MNNQYKYVGERLKNSIAQQLILELFAGQSSVNKKDIDQAVETEHINRGGVKHTKVTPPVTDALSKLKERGLANNPNRSLWDIFQDPGKRDSGRSKRNSKRGCVYIYYYPSYKELAELKGEDRGPCKIGRTHTENPQDRIQGQVTAMPEKPTTAVVMWTENPRELEENIQGILKEKDMHIQDAPGNEWFLISPGIAKKVAQALKDLENSLDF